MREAWMIDEQSIAGREHLNSDFVAVFDDKQGHPDPSEDLRLFSDQGLGRDSTLIDFGAGTGQFAVPAAKTFGRVIAVDVSPAMLEVLKRRAVEAELPM